MDRNMNLGHDTEGFLPSYEIPVYSPEMFGDNEFHMMTIDYLSEMVYSFDIFLRGKTSDELVRAKHVTRSEFLDYKPDAYKVILTDEYELVISSYHKVLAGINFTNDVRAITNPLWAGIDGKTFNIKSKTKLREKPEIMVNIITDDYKHWSDAHGIVHASAYKL